MRRRTENDVWEKAGVLSEGDKDVETGRKTDEQKKTAIKTDRQIHMHTIIIFFLWYFPMRHISPKMFLSHNFGAHIRSVSRLQYYLA